MKSPNKLEKLLGELLGYKDSIREIREILLANLVMINEIPAVTFDEADRVEFILNRFTEAGLDRISTDEAGNAFGIIRGSEGDRTILVGAHLDTAFGKETDHTITMESSTVRGVGVADNSLGCAVVASLPIILQQLGIQPKANILLMGATRSLGQGDLGGIRFFLDHCKEQIDYGIFVEGVQLGRLSYSAIGMLRGQINCNIPDEYDWTLFNSSNAITILNDVVSKVLAIPLPSIPRTAINFGSFNSGNSYTKTPTSGTLTFQVHSEQAGMIGQLQERLEEITQEVSSYTRSEVTLEIQAQRKTGGIEFSHPLTTTAKKVMETLDVTPVIAPSIGELSALIDKKIPGITIGITEGSKVQSTKENIKIEPIFSGIAQLAGILQAMDEGICDE